MPLDINFFFFFSQLLVPVVIDAKVMLFLWGKKMSIRNMLM